MNVTPFIRGLCACRAFAAVITMTKRVETLFACFLQAKNRPTQAEQESP